MCQLERRLVPAVVLVLTAACATPPGTPNLEANKQALLRDFALRTEDYIQHNPRFVALTGVRGPEARAKAIEAVRIRDGKLAEDWDAANLAPG